MKIFKPLFDGVGEFTAVSLVSLVLVALLELVVPAVEVDVKDDHAAGGQPGHQEPERREPLLTLLNCIGLTLQ